MDIQESADAEPMQEPAPADVANPMATFARLVSGEWKMTFEAGTSMIDTWHWGPSRRSLRVMTHGEAAGGEPWRALEVIYWHPGREQVRLLGLSPYERSVFEGTITFEGETAEAVCDLYQTSIRRRIVQRWAFDGPAQHLKALTPFLGHAWASRGKAEGERATGLALPIQSTLEGIPYADGVYVRVLAPSVEREPTHLLDAYVYHHTGTGRLRCLALSSGGGVHEGDVTVLDGGTLQLDLTSYQDDRVVPHAVRFDFEEDGSLRNRIWSFAGSARTLVLDVHHAKLEPEKD